MFYRNIVVAVDNDIETEHVCDRAMQLADAADAEITLVHVVQPEPPMVAPGVMGAAAPGPALSEEQQREMVEQAETSLSLLTQRLDKARLNQVQPDSTEKPVKSRVVRAPDPRVALHEIARELSADLIVAGSHGRHGLALFFSGSVASDMLKKAPCDVLAVKIQ